MIAANDLEKFTLPTLELPEPCFMASLQCDSMRDKESLIQVLQKITNEDNSLQFNEDQETG